MRRATFFTNTPNPRPWPVVMTSVKTAHSPNGSAASLAVLALVLGGVTGVLRLFTDVRTGTVVVALLVAVAVAARAHLGGALRRGVPPARKPCHLTVTSCNDARVIRTWWFRGAAVLLTLALAGCANTPIGSPRPSTDGPLAEADPSAAEAAPQARPPGDLSIFSLNASGWEAFGRSWDERAVRVAAWLGAHQPAPDVIALQDVIGQVELFRPRRCDEVPPRQGLAGYDQIHQLVVQLQGQLGVQYRVAYLTGHSYQWPVQADSTLPVCTLYSAQAMLYRPDLLQNRTAERLCAQCSPAENWESWTETPNLR